MGSPIFLVKARLQNQGNKAAKFSYGYSGPIDAVKQIFKQEGLKGFFRGVEGAVPRVVVGSASQLSSYATCKRAVVATGLFKEDGVSTYNDFDIRLDRFQPFLSATRSHSRLYIQWCGTRACWMLIDACDPML